MNGNSLTGVLRGAGCGALLALLAFCGYLGAGGTPAAVPGVPVIAERISEDVLTFETLAQTRQSLSSKREQALSLLESVIGHPSAGEEALLQALAEKTALAARIAQEAEIEALLSQMGFGETASIVGEGIVTVIAPWQAAENEQNRMRMIDAAASQTGMGTENIKIIPAKNE